MNITIFDLDKTLIKTDSGDLFAEYLCQIGLIKDVKSFKQQVKYYEKEYCAGRLDFLGYYKFAISQLVGIKISELKKIVADFVKEKISPLICDESFNVIEWHRSRGDHVLLISATIELLVEEIGRSLGFEPDNIISVRMETANGYYTGNIIGQPSYEEGKLIRLKQWCLAHKVNLSDCHTWFYSDSIHDLPLLKYVNCPIVVNPDQRLLTYAQQKKWPIINMDTISINSLRQFYKKISV